MDQACDFIADWCQEKGSYAGRPISADFAVPDCIVRLNARIGDLWRGSDNQPAQYATPFLGVLGGQDQILSPGDYKLDKDGIVPFVWENQGVWSYGFDPRDPDQLLVSGDWCDGLRGDFETEWRRVAARTEDALVCALLLNLCMQSVADWDDDAPKPEAAHLVLWQHPAWRGFDGFWIDDERTLIYFSGWRVTRSQQS